MNSGNIQPISHFRTHATAFLKKMRETGAPIVLTQNGKAAAVMVPPEEWTNTQESLAMLQIIALRLDDVKNGKVLDFETGMDQIDAMIESHDER